ncbi:uncharacterized protein RHOBADRAFT_42217 [Rhodotorula graminis WP1]|uniref:Proteophosphoglycan ppg4 n=1 Tax=Rhodotorula graminis (strain WP1) TaxID=578459 RepID=A0A194S963_RHOGW|nr:uncharacterized protein RHOBADRAFT_42217 [Rhodotorula graminis WP1]KPV77005.1 hypothetical protein RHOBADRAFT_42217 [Rhodotorula graminis WP1]
MSTDNPTAPPAKTPSSPGDSSSTTSWTATEVAISDPGDSATATPSSPVDSLSTRPEQAHTARSLEASSNEDGSPGGGDHKLKTPSSPTWSRSKLPVSDDEREGGVVEPVKTNSLDSSTSAVVDKEDKPTNDAALPKDLSTPAKPASARPAFVVTRPTAMGENEVVNVTQPSTPSASVHEDDEPANNAALKAVEVALKPAASPDSLKPVIQITTFLPDTQAFVASPASTNLPSAISPRTSAFFSSDFSMSGPRSPPRPGGAIIMELPSDVELDVDIEVRRSARTVVSSAGEQANARIQPAALPQRTSPATSTKHRSRSPSPQPPPRERRADEPLFKSRDRRSRSRQRHAGASHSHGANLSDADSSASEPDAAGRTPFLPRRTVVSSAAPFLSRTELLREQSRRRERDQERERDRRDEPEPVRARREAPHDEPQRSSEGRRRDHERDERRRDERDAERRHRDVESARREPAHEPRRPEAARHDQAATRSRRHESERHDSRRRDAASAEQPRKPALARLLDAVQDALDHDPTAYYALKGLLSEHELSISQRRRSHERKAPGPVERHHERDEDRSSVRDGRDGLVRDEQRSYERERREKRIPVDLLGRTGGGSGSETEVGFEKVKRGDGSKSSHSQRAPGSKLRTPRFFSTHPPRRDSPSPPLYPSHLSPQRTSHTHRQTPDLVRPVPVHAHDDAPRSRDESERRAPRPAQTLTLAQAAKLAAGLGDERLAEELRASGLSGRDKVTKLGERVKDSSREDGERRDEGRLSAKVKVHKASGKVGADEELKLRRRHGDERGESSSSSRHGPSTSAKDALRSSIFKVRPPVVIDDVPVVSAATGKSSRRRRDNDEPYRSPTTGSAARATSHFDRPSRSAAAASQSYDLDDYA